ncbi:hypothetical protein VTK26DRAFT_3999 [Humicola hyalothermophila]
MGKSRITKQLAIDQLSKAVHRWCLARSPAPRIPAESVASLVAQQEPTSLSHACRGDAPIRRVPTPNQGLSLDLGVKCRKESRVERGRRGWLVNEGGGSYLSTLL